MRIKYIFKNVIRFIYFLYISLFKNPALNGTYGRRVRIRLLLRRWDMSFNSIKLFQDQAIVDAYKQKGSHYKRICVRRLYSDRIGEYIIRYVHSEIEASKNNETLYVYILSDYENVNKRLTTVMSRECEENVVIATREDRWSWLYLCLNDKRFDLEEQNIYCSRDDWDLVDDDFAKKHLKLSEQEIVEGDIKETKMGLRQPFVCVSNRDSAYMTMRGATDNVARNACMQNSLKAYNYLVNKGITCVRMGRTVCQKFELDGCIDYASEHYDELMDLYLSSQCKFFISAASGVMQYAITVGTPIVLTNDVDSLIGGWGGSPQSENNIIIFKHFYKIEENRYLSIKEMMDILNKYRDSGMSLYKEGIELIENTPDEIYDAVVEMNERLDGVWIETPEAQELQNRYKQIVDEWHAENGTLRHNAFRGRAATGYLKRNQYLLL